MKKGIDQRYIALLALFGECPWEPGSFGHPLHILLLRELLSGSSAGF